MRRPGPRQGQQDSGCTMGTARPAVGTSACSGSAWPKQGISKTQHEAVPSLVVGSRIRARRKPFLYNWGWKEMPLSSPFSWCSQPQVCSCISPKPLSASTPGRRAGLGLPRPPQQPRDFSTEFYFWYYFYTLVLISHVGSASRFWALKNLLHPLWKALHSSSHPCLQSTQSTTALSQICPIGDKCN